MEERELIYLLYNASRSFTSLDVEWHYLYDAALMRQLTNDWLGTDREDDGSAFVQFTSPKEAQLERFQGFTSRVWWRKPDCWRDEFSLNPQSKVRSRVTILCKGEGYIYNYETNALQSTDNISDSLPKQTNSRYSTSLAQRITEVPLVDPAFLLATHTFQISSPNTYINRPVVEVTATYNHSRNQAHELMPFFWSAADYYQLVVDLEHGVLLQYSAIVNGEQVAIASVDTINFDHPIPDQIFEPVFD